jgi:hypothetical protein
MGPDMNMKHGGFLGFFPVLFGLALGCSSDAKDEHPLVGTWQVQQSAGGVTGTTTIVFSADKALTMTVASSAGGLKQSGTWSAQGAELSMAFAKCSTLAADATETAASCQKAQSKAQYSVAGSTLTLITTVEGTDNRATTTLSKK